MRPCARRLRAVQRGRFVGDRRHDGSETLISFSVQCRSEYAYAQEPIALVGDAGVYPITHIAARWRTPAGPAFRVVCALGQYILAYDEALGRWSVTPCAPEGCAGCEPRQD